MARRPPLTLRWKLVLLAFALVVLPAGIFGIIASRDASRALEATVGHQLHMVAANVGGDLEAALAEQQGKLRGWADQEVMREIIVGDVDKRVSRLLVGLPASTGQSRLPRHPRRRPDPQGRTIAAPPPTPMCLWGRERDRSARARRRRPRDRRSRAFSAGPAGASSSSPPRSATPRTRPRSSGVLVATYDWTRSAGALVRGVAPLPRPDGPRRRDPRASTSVGTLIGALVATPGHYQVGTPTSRARG